MADRARSYAKNVKEMYMPKLTPLPQQNYTELPDQMLQRNNSGQQNRNHFVMDKNELLNADLTEFG